MAGRRRSTYFAFSSELRASCLNGFCTMNLTPPRWIAVYTSSARAQNASNDSVLAPRHAASREVMPPSTKKRRNTAPPTSSRASASSGPLTLSVLSVSTLLKMRAYRAVRTRSSLLDFDSSAAADTGGLPYTAPVNTPHATMVTSVVGRWFWDGSRSMARIVRKPLMTRPNATVTTT